LAEDLLTFAADGDDYSLTLSISGTATTGAVGKVTGSIDGHTVEGPRLFDQNGGLENNVISTAPLAPDLNDDGISFIAGSNEYNIYYTKGFYGFAIETSANGEVNNYFVSNFHITPNVCFVRGTHILTDQGEVPVEALRVGDLAITSSGAQRPIKWLGHRRVNCAQHPRSYEALPVRICAHAFGPDKPHRDLYVSPGHALCLDVAGEVLIRAHSLVNGATIQQVETDSVVYWHVELDSHDVLLAENLPAESYLDMGNRNFFVESGVVLIETPPDAIAQGAKSKFCRPLHTDGPLIPAIRSQLRVQAQALGWTLSDDPFNDLHLVVDGVRLDPLRDGLTAHFDVPVGAQHIRLVSIASKPCFLPGDNSDNRDLSLCLDRMSVGEREIALEDPRLVQGFHPLEVEDWGSFRWTDGEALLPASLFDDAPQARRLSLQMLRPALEYWVAPKPKRQVEAA
jgi:hypothetical protein